MVDLPSPRAHTIDAIEAAYADRADARDGRGVPMSAAVSPCPRQIWYGLRWASPHRRTDGPTQSRFETGAYWEQRLLDDLRTIGCDVLQIDEATGQQYSVACADGWLRGKLDGIVTGLPEAPQTPHVVECKSTNEKGFRELVKKGVKEAKPYHYAQTQLYMHCTGHRRALYICVNKNTDEQYAERVEYDPVYCLQTEGRISRIVNSERPPERVEGYYCAWCDHRAACLEGARPRRNCRTCLHSTFLPGAEVHCAKYDEIRSYELQAGCQSSHRYIPALINGEQVDVDDDETVHYRLEDGTIWKDAGK